MTGQQRAGLPDREPVWSSSRQSSAPAQLQAAAVDRDRARLGVPFWSQRVLLALIHPVVLVFLIAAYFSYLTGDTVRACYLLAVGVALAWDQASRRRSAAAAPAEQASDGDSGPRAAFSAEAAERTRSAMRRLLIPALLVAVGYSVLVGSFHRYSWPATVAVTVPAAVGIVLAWRLSVGSQGKPLRPSAVGLTSWALVWAGAAAWELAALYLQPNLTTDSSAHPTLSYLADPVLASMPGRSIALFLWLLFGWYLARR